MQKAHHRSPVRGLSNAELAACQKQWPDMEFVEARMNHDATEVVGSPTAEILVREHGQKYTLYVVFMNDKVEAQWDVGGWMFTPMERGDT